MALAQALLAMGNYKAGWREYEWRIKISSATQDVPRITSFPWNGMHVNKLLVIGDQGFGDTIQFIRYLPLIRDRCNEIIVGCCRELEPLLSKFPGITRYTSRWDQVGEQQAHIRLSSLPYLLYPEVPHIPCDVPIYIRIHRRWASGLAGCRIPSRM
jgi:hypothetical protein